MSILVRNWDVVVVYIERSFGSQLVLTPREHIGVVIGSSAIFDSFIGFTYSVVASPISTVIDL